MRFPSEPYLSKGKTPRAVSADYAGPNGERGPDGMAVTIKPLIAAFPDMQWTIGDLLADGEKVVLRWT